MLQRSLRNPLVCALLSGLLSSCSDEAGQSADASDASTASAAVGAGGSGTSSATTGTESTAATVGTSATGSQGATSSSTGATTNAATITSTAGGTASTTEGGSGTGGTSSSGGSGGGGGSGGSGGSGGVTSTGGTGSTEIDPDAIIVAPDGTPGAPGTLDEPTTLPDALDRAAAGVTIYLRGGSYGFGSTLDLSGAGNDTAPILLHAYPLDDERPLLDFSAMTEDSGNRGLSLSGDYWHVYGIDVLGAGDNGMFVSGSHNTIEYATFSECADTGLQLGNGASDNLILNCDSFYNADSSLENADGFAAKLDVGSGNKFVGCRAWNNLDDGWDGYLRPANDITTSYEDCWAIDNGKLQDGSIGAGDGNGFKTGGSDDKDLSHNASYTRCIATGNVHDGFDHNSNRGSVTILNSAAHDNGANINFGTSNIAASLTIKNTLSLGTNGDLSATSTDITNNSWQDGRAATADDFVSIDASVLTGPRKSDGSLPDIDYLRLAPGSDLLNAGVDLGLPYSGAAPDIGPFESDE